MCGGPNFYAERRWLALDTPAPYFVNRALTGVSVFGRARRVRALIGGRYPGRIAQLESVPFTRERSKVRSRAQHGCCIDLFLSAGHSRSVTWKQRIGPALTHKDFRNIVVSPVVAEYSLAERGWPALPKGEADENDSGNLF